MAVRKISISIDEDALEDAKACADAEGVSLSAWLADAARDRARLLGWKRLYREFENEFGPSTPEERDAALAWVREGERQHHELDRARREEPR